MKVNEINVDAFRGFESYNNFNLLKNDAPVSIAVFYAPNGTGKTSLVEALEWNLTGQVERLTALLNSYHKKPKEGHILKNKQSEKCCGCVEIILDNGRHIKRETKPLTGRMNNDYSDGSWATNLVEYDELDKKQIKKNILSQNNINDFLITASTGNIFNAFFGLDNNAEDLEIYHKIKSKHNNISKAINEKEQLKFKSIAASKTLEKELIKIKNVISDDLNEKIELCLYNLSNYYKYDFGDIEHYSPLEFTLDYIDKVRISSLDIYNATSTVSNRIKNIRLKRKYITIFNFIKWANNKEAELNNKSNKLEEKLLKYRNVSNLINSENYQRYKDEYSLINNRKVCISNRITRTSNLIKSIENSISSLNLHIHKPNYKNAEEQYSKFEFFMEQTHHFKNLQELNNEIDKTMSFINISNNISRKILQGDIFLFDEEEVNSLNIEDKLISIRKNKKLRDQKNKVREVSLKRFQELSNVKSSLIDLKSKSKDLINKTSESACPVCNAKYNSISDLLDSIDKEFKVIDEGLYTDIIDLEKEIDQLNNNIKNQKDELHDYLIKSRENINSELSKYNSKKNLYLEFKCFIDTLEPDLKNLDFAHISIHLKNASNNALKSITNLESRYKTLLKRQSTLNDIIEKCNEGLHELIARNNTNEYKLEASGYGSIVNSVEFDVYKDNTKSLSYEINTLESEVKSLTKDLNKIKLQLLSRTTEISSDEFISLSESPVEEIRASLSTEIEELNSLKHTYRELRRKLRKLKIKEIITTLEEITSHSLIVSSLISEFNMQDKIKELNIKINLNKKEQDKHNKEIEVLEEKRNAYHKAITDSQEFFSSLVDRKLNKKILNDIFRIIDPHSTFKHLDIEIDMSKGNEKMHIKSKSTPNDNKSTSVLYFSEAQTNILSLSLFLSNHANSEGLINTLILDDPIQSMDDINAYSFIDLCRIYTKRFNKQLIITTHDKNFFELFKSRLPEVNFPCKYFNLLDDIQ